MLPFYNEILDKSKVTLGTVSRMPSFASNLYTFYYRSKTGSDTNPFVLLIMSKQTGNSIYQANNGNRYMLALNLGYISSVETRNLIIERLSLKEGTGPVTWKTALTISKFFTAKSEKVFGAQNPGMLKPLIDPLMPHEDAGISKFSKSAARYFIRQYDIRKLRDLSVVDPAKYLEGMGHSI